MKTNELQWILQSPIGPLHLVATDRGLKGVYWKKKSVPLAKELAGEGPQKAILRETVTQLEEYFAGERKDFDLQLDLQGTPFQKSVWNRLMKIPYGKTRSYRDIAREIKNDRAVRAVGTANGRNPVSIIVPCHRVIASDGTLGGYAGGLPTKTRLLDLERSRSGRK